MNKKAIRILTFVLLGLVLIGLYVCTILWRVGSAEQEDFGRNYLVPLSAHPREYIEQGTPNSYGDTTYSFSRNGVTVHVYKQLTNSFQHVYGSALASFELGQHPADLLFRANEYVEALFCSKSGTEDFYLDTKKDLANNEIGRQIGLEAKMRNLSGEAAERFIVSDALDSMNKGIVLKHYLDPRVADLPSLRSFGCPLLSTIMKIRSKNAGFQFN